MTVPHPRIIEQLQKYLLPSEQVLWTGHPPRGLRFKAFDIFLVPFSIVWASLPISMLFTGQDQTAEAPFPFAVIPWLFIAIGLYITVGRFLVDMALRARTVYAVSDRRVLLLRRVFETTLRAQDINRLQTLELRERNDGSGTITFERSPYWMRGQELFLPGLQGLEFFAIPNARTVYELITIQTKRG